jgi:polyisoprenyl-teichoic acid--peptidoglycan teichoic acid transferase
VTPDVPRLGLAMAKRFAVGAVLIVLLSATAVASAVLLEVDKNIEVFQEASVPIPDIENELDKVDPGGPQTILVLGSDRRFGDAKAGIPARSDTIIVVRLDPDKNATAILSIPRDLRVDIPGHGRDKINTAYALGGPKLTVRTVKELLGIPISHVVNVNFGGFRRAVDRLGCVYVDIDRRYFNDRGGPGGYATIDLKPGYQKLCGKDALDYVRYRHTDDDFVRAQRQQEFLRQAKNQIGLGKVFGDRRELLRIFGRYTQTDIARDNDAAILRLLKLAYESSKHPIREIRFRGEQSPNGDYVEISHENLQRTVDEFIEVGLLGTTDPEPAPRRPSASSPARASRADSSCASRRVRTTSSTSPRSCPSCRCTSPRRDCRAAVTSRTAHARTTSTTATRESTVRTASCWHRVRTASTTASRG